MTLSMVHGNHIFHSPSVIGKSMKDATSDEIYAAKEASMAILLLQNADPVRYGELTTSLKKGASLGRDEYPTSVVAMHELMVKFNRDNNRSQRTGGNRNNRKGNLFAQTRASATSETNEPVPGTDSVLHAHIRCFTCQQFGHHASCCPVADDNNRRGATALMRGTSLATDSSYYPVIEEHRLLLDSCSTDNVCRNLQLLKNIENVTNRTNCMWLPIVAVWCATLLEN